MGTMIAVATDGGIPAASGDCPGKAEIVVYSFEGGRLVDRGVRAVAYNAFPCPVAGGAKVLLQDYKESGVPAWFVVAEAY